MGDRYELNKKCVYCNTLNEDIWYAPTCNSMTFKCSKCNKINFITTEFIVKRVEEVTYEDVYSAINNASNIMDDKMIKECAKDFFDELRGER